MFQRDKGQSGNEAPPPLARGAFAAGSFGVTLFLSPACGACIPASHNASENPCAELLGVAAITVPAREMISDAEAEPRCYMWAS